MKRSTALLFAMVVGAAGSLGYGADNMGVAGAMRDMRCESQVNPLAIEVAAPRFSWKPGQPQTAYRILVASKAELLGKDQGDLWDSGKVASDETVQIAYRGKALATNQQAFWRVTLWNGNEEKKGDVAHFSMGILKPEEWKAKWIAFPNDNSMKQMLPDPCFHKEFTANKPVARAVVHICGLGQYEMMLNGQRVGDHQIAPGWTVYQKTCNYDTYDVTAQVKQGGNGIGVMLGNGMYNCLQVQGRYTKNNNTSGFPKLIMQMEITYADGTHEQVITDESWTTARGPMVVDQEYGGEDYDARREFPGWDSAGFKGGGDEWVAVAMTQAPGDVRPLGSVPGKGAGTAQLAAAYNPPTKIQKVYEPVKVTQAQNGGWIYDFGQNLSGWPHFKVKGAAGATIKITPGEVLGRGSVSQSTSGGPMWYSYILRGGGEEEYRPKFMYYGYRYILVQGAAPAGQGDGSLPQISAMSSEWLYADAPVVGQFESSDMTLNRIHALINGAVKSNMQSVLTDCPHREKLGWLEQVHLTADALAMNYDMSNLYAKTCQDARDAQLANGLIPSTAPEYVVFGPKDLETPAQGYRDSPEWGSTGVILPWYIYETYGDVRTLEAQYEAMKQYVSYLGSRSKEDIVSHGLGDWYDIGPKGPGPAQLTSRDLTATGSYFQDIEVLRKTAALLNRPEEVKLYTEMSERVRAAFNGKFFDAQTAQYEKGSQTANAFPLAVGLVDPEKREAVLANLVEKIRENQNRVTAGDVGFSYVVKALTEGQQGELMYDMMTNPTGPGYVAQLNKGATTLTEAWDANGKSQNHLMLGHAEAWLFRGLGGIQNAPGSIGFKKIIIRPQIVEKLATAGPKKFVHVSFDSPRGLIVSHWELEGKRLTMDVTVPATATAVIYVPSADPNGIISSGTAMGLTPGIAKDDHGARLFGAKAGTYKFVSTLP